MSAFWFAARKLIPRVSIPVVTSVPKRNIWSTCTSIANASRLASPMIPQGFQIRTMASKRHKKVIKLAKGFRGRANRCYSVAYHRVLKAQQYAYRDRKVKKREARKLWIQRMNAAARMHGLSYSVFVNRLGKQNIRLDRKVLANLAVTEPLSFKSVVDVIKASM